jgi:hypothetical protein
MLIEEGRLNLTSDTIDKAIRSWVRVRVDCLDSLSRRMIKSQLRRRKVFGARAFRKLCLSTQGFTGVELKFSRVQKVRAFIMGERDFKPWDTAIRDGDIINSVRIDEDGDPVYLRLNYLPLGKELEEYYG